MEEVACLVASGLFILLMMSMQAMWFGQVVSPLFAVIPSSIQ